MLVTTLVKIYAIWVLLVSLIVCQTEFISTISLCIPATHYHILFFNTETVYIFKIPRVWLNHSRPLIKYLYQLHSSHKLPKIRQLLYVYEQTELLLISWYSFLQFRRDFVQHIKANNGPFRLKYLPKISI